jgi:positive regulator of sigma E activity
MRDSGIVVTAEGTLAQVRVECTLGCRECSASSLCKGAGQKEGLLSVRNPVRALPGDQVTIEVPENRYHRVLIVMFASLLAASLLGALAGSWLSGPLSLDAALAAPLGFLLGLGLAVPALAQYFRKNNQRRLYPWITAIIPQKGERHG